MYESTKEETKIYAQNKLRKIFIFTRWGEQACSSFLFYVNISVIIIMIDPMKKYTLFLELYFLELGIYSVIDILIIIPAVIASVMLWSRGVI